MKEILPDRFDILLEKAKANDSKAQLKLAKWFFKGHLVEKSIPQAKYWAFKALWNGNLKAEKFFNSLL